MARALREWITRPGLPQIGRYGLMIAAFAGVLVMIAPFVGDAASGPARDAEGTTTFSFNDTNTLSLVLIGLIALAAVGITARSQRLWAHFVGVLLACAAAVIYARAAALARSESVFEEGASTTLEAGGLMLAAAYIVALVGIVIALTQTRGIQPLVREPAEGEDEDAKKVERSPTATSGLVLSILGLVVPLIGGAAGTMVSAVALTDIKQSGMGGRGWALAGLAIGAIVFTVYATTGLVQVTTAEPS